MSVSEIDAEIVPADAVGQVTIRAMVAGAVTFASHQNSVPILRDLAVLNEGTETLDGLTLTLHSEPAFLAPKSWHLAQLGPGGERQILDRDVRLDGRFLHELTEAVRGEVVLTLRQGDMEIAASRHDIRLLARNEWGGIVHMPEMVAAFVMPNDPAVDRLLSAASEGLRRAGKQPALDGYAGGSRRRVWEMAAAIWTAVAARGLDYALPPASFERQGQKVRTPSVIADAGRATCLDLTLLFAACLEQAGLNPVVVFTHGHAFAGVWLQPSEFSTVALDDPVAVRNRVKLDELILFETTVVTQRPVPTFSAAVRLGAEQVAEAREDTFDMIVDIRRARMQRITALPAAGTLIDDGAEEPQAPVLAVEEAPNLADFDFDPRPAMPRDEAPQSRLDRWQRKLLDLSLRNRLLNFRATRKAIPLLCPDPALLEDRLAAGARIKLVPRPALTDEAAGRSEQIHLARTGQSIAEDYACEALARNEILAEFDSEELDRRLTDLFRSARMDLQEGGANTLFIALGFLVWKKRDGEERRYRAPLVLVPVTLERRSVRAGFSIILHEDEPRFNPTLVEMLEHDFAIRLRDFDEGLLKDESGIDIRGVWNRVRHAVKDTPGFEVAEEVVVSTFSFAKFLMWKDLVERTEQLKQNPVVRHLLDTPRDPYASDIAFPDPRTLDETLPPDAVFAPLPADSSQLAAVAAAAAGKDFVLIGPPGTGKSQTIANMIAQNLAEGRKVLFVAEKTAALDVVYRRLREQGLSEFCLELHSNKARKLDVLEQLRTAWGVRGEMDGEEWRREAVRLKAVRDDLNRVVARLHTVHGNGLTLFTAMGSVIEGRERLAPALAWPQADFHDRDALQRLGEVAARIDVNAGTLGAISGSVFAPVTRGDWSPAFAREVADAARAVAAVTREFEAAIQLFTDAVHFDRTFLPRGAVEAVAGLARTLLDAHGKDLGITFDPGLPAVIERVAEARALAAEHAAQRAGLSVPYAEGATETLDLDRLEGAWARADGSWWPMSWFARRGVRTAMGEFAKGAPSPATDLPRLQAMRRLETALAGHDDLASIAGRHWRGLATNFALLERDLALARTLRRLVAEIGGDHPGMARLRDSVEPLLGAANDLLAGDSRVGRLCRAVCDAETAFLSAVARLNAAGGGDPTVLAAEDNPAWLQALAARASDLAAHEGGLSAWCGWRRVRDEAATAGLGSLVQAVESGDVAAGQAAGAFRLAYCRWWVEAMVEHDDVLRLFVVAEHESRIAEFKALDERFLDVTRRYIRARLAADLPDRSDVKRSSELGVLSRELEKRRAHLPVRALIQRMPDSFTRLTPCLMMSPLSIAQYLSADTALFDVVIFDEASQITVWDAVGAIARGRQAVIVGDPKQLPPTSFFGRNEDEDDEAVEVESDLESILDEALGANLPSRDLAWHYRSRHESLIAFSNHHYYGGRLVTFPSAVTDDRAVRLVHVERGLYEKGGGRINRPEAEAIVTEVVRRLRAPLPHEQGLTIGIVTFNAEQQALIEDLLDAERGRDPELEPFFSEEQIEPVIVKNLENVQGDERDVILFSITYGPDNQGRVSMNFGPMNRDGGERRLNVAVTRARRELLVFSTLKAEHIDLSRTQSIGVRDLKHFLDFAERGPKALPEFNKGSVGGFESSFEQAVARRLSERGWRVLPQIGVSAFRVDLGVVHPDAPGRFLAGVECDGATYHRSATARDRDKLREQVLVGLGWTIVRVWSTDWWMDPQGALDRLDARLTQLLDADRAATEIVPEIAVEPPAPVETAAEEAAAP